MLLLLLHKMDVWLSDNSICFVGLDRKNKTRNKLNFQHTINFQIVVSSKSQPIKRRKVCCGVVNFSNNPPPRRCRRRRRQYSQRRPLRRRSWRPFDDRGRADVGPDCESPSPQSSLSKAVEDSTRRAVVDGVVVAMWRPEYLAYACGRTLSSSIGEFSLRLEMLVSETAYLYFILRIHLFMENPLQGG